MKNIKKYNQEIIDIEQGILKPYTLVDIWDNGKYIKRDKYFWNKESCILRRNKFILKEQLIGLECKDKRSEIYKNISYISNKLKKYNDEFHKHAEENNIYCVPSLENEYSFSVVSINGKHFSD